MTNQKGSLIISVFIIAIVALVSTAGTYLLIKKQSSLSQQFKGSTPTPTYVFQTPTPTLKNNQLSVTPGSTTKPTVKPTAKQIPTNTPKIIPTNTQAPAPTSTPTPIPTAIPTQRTPNPPIINISYPSDMQSIELSSGQQFCIVDVPAGGDTSGVQRHHSINDGSWSGYVDMFTLCFDPIEGLNRFSVQYRNKYGDESTMYTRQFTFHRISS